MNGPKRVLAGTLMALSLLIGTNARADELIMMRVPQAFPEAMNLLQESIREQGYTVSRVQRVDVGLTRTGYKTAEYRVVFFGKPEEMDKLPAKFPDLIPYLPLKVTIFAERSETILVTLNPAKLGEFFHGPGLAKQFHEWERDVREIFERIHEEA